MDEKRLDNIEKSMVRLETNQGWMMRQLSNHLAHHDKYLYWMVGVLGTIGIGLILNVIL